MSGHNDDGRIDDTREAWFANQDTLLIEFGRRKSQESGHLNRVSINADKPTLGLPLGSDILTPEQTRAQFTEWRADYAAAKEELPLAPQADSATIPAIEIEEPER